MIPWVHRPLGTRDQTFRSGLLRLEHRPAEESQGAPLPVTSDVLRFAYVTWIRPAQMGYTRQVIAKTYIHTIDEPKAWA